MPFRDRAWDDRARDGGTLDRYFALVSGFGLDSSALGARVPLLLAAASLLRHGGEPRELIRATMAASRAIDLHPGWLAIHGGGLRFVLAAILVANHRDPEAFVSERSSLFETFEALEVHYSPVDRTLAVLGLRLTGDDEPITGAQIRQLQAIYVAICSRYPVFADARLLAICGLLTARSTEADAPEVLGQRVHTVYKLLRRRARLSWGLPLLSASTILATSEFEPEAITERVGELAQALRGVGLAVEEREYEELAVLSLLALPVERIAELVQRYRTRIRAHFNWHEDAPIAFVLSADLLLADCVTADPKLGALVDLKLALDATA